MSKPILIGYHFSKTGGTSLVRHARKNLKPNEWYIFGAHMNAKRIEAGRPLLQDLSIQERNRIRFVSGHGVGSGVVRLFAPRPTLLFTVIRDPFARFISVYKHRLRTMPEISRPTPRELFNQQPANPFVNEILKRFGGNDIFETLKRFDMILVTELLDDQSAILFRHIDLSGIKERARVYPEKPDLGDVTKEEIYTRDSLDLEIHTRLLRCGISEGNPFR